MIMCFALGKMGSMKNIFLIEINNHSGDFMPGVNSS
jgi:hypothetical protein